MEPDQVTAELQISVAQLNDALETQASRFAYWSALAVDALRAARDAKLQAQVADAQAYVRVRNERLEAQDSASRATQFASEAKNADADRVAAWQRYNEAQRRADWLQTVSVAFAQRKDLLVTIAANLRGEMTGQPRVHAQPAQQLFSTEMSVPPQTPAQSQKRGISPSQRLHELQSTFHKQQENQK